MQTKLSLEEFSSVVASIHAATAFPERWPAAVAGVADLMNSTKADSGWDGGLEKLLELVAPGEEPGVYLAAASEPSVRRVMGLLAQHLKTAKQVQMKLAETLLGRLALASLDRLAVAAFIIDRSGAVQHLNTSARALLDDGRWVRVRGPGLRFNQAELNVRFEGALRKATEPPQRASLLPLSSGKKDVCEIAVSPLEADHPSLPACPAPLALVVIPLPRPDEARIAQRVRRLYSLTEAEARVVAALTSGGTVDEIAIRHGVRASTVRAQVRSIFEKIGVNRQADLVRLALTGAPLLVGPDC